MNKKAEFENVARFRQTTDVAQRNPSGGAGFIPSSLKVFRFLMWVGSMVTTITIQSGIVLPSSFWRWCASIALIVTSFWVWWQEHRRVIEYETPRLKIGLSEKMGRPYGQTRINYHLKVQNVSRTPAESCRVSIIRILKWEDVKWDDQLVNASPLTWHSTDAAIERTINDEETFDLGCLNSEGNSFCPAYKHTGQGFGELKSGETLRYFISAAGKSAYMEKPFVIEVSWDGIFDAAHLRCKPIDYDKAESETTSN
jgi:hypothetical protein